MHILWVMMGGFAGAMARAGVGEWLGGDGFPFGTLAMNLIGCFVLGWFLTLLALRSHVGSAWNPLVGTGFLGSFTTFSAFSVETVQLWRDGFAIAVVYVIVSVVAGLLLAFTGYRLAVVKSKGGDIA